MSLLKFMKTYSVLGVLQVLPPRCHLLLQINTHVPTNLTMGQYIQYYPILPSSSLQTNENPHICMYNTWKLQYTIAVLSSNIKFNITSAIHVWYPAKKNNTDYLEKFCKAKLRVAVTGTLNVTHVLPQDCHLHQPGQPNYSEVDWWHDFHANCIPWPVCCPTPIPTRVVSGYVGSRSR